MASKIPPFTDSNVQSNNVLLSVRTELFNFTLRTFICSEFFVPGVIYVEIHRLMFFSNDLFRNASDHI